MCGERTTTRFSRTSNSRGWWGWWGWRRRKLHEQLPPSKRRCGLIRCHNKCSTFRSVRSVKGSAKTYLSEGGDCSVSNPATSLPSFVRFPDPSFSPCLRFPQARCYVSWFPRNLPCSFRSFISASARYSSDRGPIFPPEPSDVR